MAARPPSRRHPARAESRAPAQARRGVLLRELFFCHTEQRFFDVDHLVPDRSFRLWGIHSEARNPINMVILCKSGQLGDLGCNQSKGSRSFVPDKRGLAYSRRDLDLNCSPLTDRPNEYGPAYGSTSRR